MAHFNTFDITPHPHKHHTAFTVSSKLNEVLSFYLKTMIICTDV